MGAILFFCTYQRLIPLWVNAQVMPSVATAAALSGFAVFFAIHNASSMCLNGCNRLIGQVLYQIPTALLGIFLAIHLSHRYGVGGIAISFTIAEGCVAMFQLTEIRLFLRRLAAHSRDMD